jgi:hypothetical protein
MSMTQIFKHAVVWMPVCLLPCLTACAPRLEVQPTKPVKVVEYKPRPISADLLREAEPTTLPPQATWSDVWNAYLQERANNERLNCQLEAIADHLSDKCRGLLDLQPRQHQP